MTALSAKRPPARGFSRRGACPALSAPMQTGDGLLARLNPVAGGLSPTQLAGLCDAADLFGNGVIEVTARGSVQVRGLTDATAARLAAAVDELGIAVRTGVPVQTGVLAGRDAGEVADPTALAENIRAGIAGAGLNDRLAPKVSVVIDGGGRAALDEAAADVRLTALRNDGTPRWLVAIAGDARTARPLGIADGDDAACRAALALLAALAKLGGEARARDLDDERLSGVIDGWQDWRSTLPPSGRPEGGMKPRKSLIGTIDLSDGKCALGVALPFGQTTAGLLKAFAQKAREVGVEDIRPAPLRTLVAICGTAAAAAELKGTAASLGFVTAGDDPRTAISACPGAPDCTSGHIAARRIAAEIAGGYGGLFDGSIHLHVSGCAKGCARPGSSSLVLVGGAGGAGLVADGTARDEPLALADGDGAGRAFASVAALLSAERLADETTAQTIGRIGLSALAEAFAKGRQ